MLMFHKGEAPAVKIGTLRDPALYEVFLRTLSRESSVYGPDFISLRNPVELAGAVAEVLKPYGCANPKALAIGRSFEVQEHTDEPLSYEVTFAWFPKVCSVGTTIFRVDDERFEVSEWDLWVFNSRLVHGVYVAGDDFSEDTEPFEFMGVDATALSVIHKIPKAGDLRELISSGAIPPLKKGWHEPESGLQPSEAFTPFCGRRRRINISQQWVL
jgi:hypothetical protein